MPASGRTIRDDSAVRTVKRDFPCHVCLTPGGNLLAPLGKTVVECAANGDEIRRFGAEVLEGPVAVEYDPESGVVIVADGSMDKLCVFSYADARFLAYWGSKTGLRSPRGLALMGRFLLVADAFCDLVWVLLRCDGSLAGSFSTTAAHSVAFDPTTNRIFVADQEHYLKVFNASTSALLCILCSPAKPPHLRHPGQIVVDDAGQIAVADFGNSRICVFAKDLSFVRSIPCAGHPTGLVLNRDGDFIATVHQ